MSSLLHVRAIVPERTHVALLGDLEQNVAVCNIVVLAAVTSKPDGHVVLFDVVREAADEIVTLLKAHDVHRDGSFSVEHTELAMGEGSDRAARLAPGDAEGAVIWSEVEETVAAASSVSAQYLAFFVVASIIAAVGVLTDSPILIVGAMVVGPEYGPLSAMAFGLHARNWTLLRQGAITFTVGTVAAIAVAVVFGVVLRMIDRIPATYIAGRPLTGFIAQPDFFAPIVAAAAAVAGVLSLTLTRTGTLGGRPHLGDDDPCHRRHRARHRHDELRRDVRVAPAAVDQRRLPRRGRRAHVQHPASSPGPPPAAGSNATLSYSAASARASASAGCTSRLSTMSLTFRLAVTASAITLISSAA